MGNAAYLSMGNGDVSFDGRDVGFLKGDNDVEFAFNYEIDQFKSKIPLSLVKVMPKEITAYVKAPVAELSPENVSMALGGLSIVSTSGEITRTDQARPLIQNYGGFGLPGVPFDGPNVEVDEVTNNAGNQTYDEGDDYIILPGSGNTKGVLLVPQGSGITYPSTIKRTYTYDPGVIHTIKLGSSFSLAVGQCEFIHEIPDTGKFIRITFWKAQVDGKLTLKFSGSNWIVNDVTFNALRDDENHPDAPFGLVELEQ